MPEFRQAQIREVKSQIKLQSRVRRKSRRVIFYRKTTSYIDVRQVFDPMKEDVNSVWWRVYNLAKEKALGEQL